MRLLRSNHLNRNALRADRLFRSDMPLTKSRLLAAFCMH
jgi:hypothetical protein